MRCVNWKVIAALVAIGVGLYAVVPRIGAGAVPLLVIAACPLSMLVMMWAMGSMGASKTKDNDDDSAGRGRR